MGCRYAVANANGTVALELALHQQAQREIHNGDVNRAWKTLLAFNAG